MNEKIAALITALSEKSMNRSVVWAKTNSNTEFQVILDSGITVTIDSYEAEDGSHNFDIGIYNNKGERIFYFSVSKRDSASNYQFLQKLYFSAKDSYYKVDETIDEILNEISLKNIVGNEPNLNPNDDELPF